MRYSDLFAEIKQRRSLRSDRELANFLGITQATLIKYKGNKVSLTPRDISKLLGKHSIAQTAQAFASSILPIVEHYPIARSHSRRQAKWEILPLIGPHSREAKIKACLSSAVGIYFFYDSSGQVIYNGKTVDQNLWKEINLAFNRTRDQHKAFRVRHPTTGTNFEPAWKRPRQPVRRAVYLHEVAAYFSAYEISRELISSIEALFIRAICNDLSNVKMERLRMISG